MHLEVGESAQSSYGTSLNSNDDPESISRKILERNLLRKLDFRTAYLVLIYILNQVRKHESLVSSVLCLCDNNYDYQMDRNNAA